VGARLAGATPQPGNSLSGSGLSGSSLSGSSLSGSGLSGSLGDDPATRRTMPKLLWVNSPSNPTGQVLGVEHLAQVVRWARQHGVVVASDECYAELDWRSGEAGPGSIPSILDPRVCDGSHEGLLAVYSMSKQSNMAGYRAAFVAGDPQLVGRLLEVRRHAGMMVPWPVQEAMTAALADDTHVAQQKALYGIRRGLLRAAVMRAGYRVEHSEAGLYLWITRDSAGVHGVSGGGADLAQDPAAQAGSDWSLVSQMADLGILVAPGSFYGVAGGRHVRLALTATDERINAAVKRLTHQDQLIGIVSET
jgi:succinyldiaminopimelate transaminase